VPVRNEKRKNRKNLITDIKYKTFPGIESFLDRNESRKNLRIVRNNKNKR